MVDLRDVSKVGLENDSCSCCVPARIVSTFWSWLARGSREAGLAIGTIGISGDRPPRPIMLHTVCPLTKDKPSRAAGPWLGLADMPPLSGWLKDGGDDFNWEDSEG